MPVVSADGIATRYEVAGNGPALLMFSPGGFDSRLENWTSFGRYRDLGFVAALAPVVITGYAVAYRWSARAFAKRIAPHPTTTMAATARVGSRTRRTRCHGRGGGAQGTWSGPIPVMTGIG